MSWLRIALCGIAISLSASMLLAGRPAPASAQGSEATVSLKVGDVVRGEKTDLAVNITVNKKSLSLRRLFVTVRGKEIVDFTYTVPEEKDSKGKQITPAKSLRVTKEEVLFEREFTIVAGQDLAPGSHHSFKGDIEIPADLPPSLKGKNVRIKWEAFAGTDIPGWFDPASSWQDVTVK
jgi:hypothetical protein